MKKLFVLSLGILLAFHVCAQKMADNTSVTIKLRVTHGDPMFVSGSGSGWVGYEYYNPYASGYETENVNWGLNTVVTIPTNAAGHININYSPDNIRIWGCCDDTPYCWKFLYWEADRRQTVYFTQGQTGTIIVNVVATPTHLMSYSLEYAKL